MTGEPTRPATIVITHGWGGNAEMTLILARPLCQAGYEVVVFDARNHGLSQADGFSSLPKFSEDTSAAIDWLRRHGKNRGEKIALVGHSIGAAAVLLTAARRNDIAAVVSISAFAHPDGLMRAELDRLPLPELIVRAILRYVEWKIGHRFDAIAPVNSVCRISCPILLSHGTADRVVPVSDMDLIRKNCPGDHIYTMTIEGADHYSIDKIEAHSVEIIDFLNSNGVNNQQLTSVLIAGG